MKIFVITMFLVCSLVACRKNPAPGTAPEKRDSLSQQALSVPEKRISPLQRAPESRPLVPALDITKWNVDAKQALLRLQKDPSWVVLDVRTSGEHRAGHIKGAKNIDVYQANFRNEVEKLDPSKSYLIHCTAGVPTGRSEKALTLMHSLNFKNVYQLKGGITAWLNAGNPVSYPKAMPKQSQ